MRCVLHAASDLEPITVLNLPPHLLQMIERREHVLLAVREPVLAQFRSDEVPCISDLKTVRIWGVRVAIRDGRVGDGRASMTQLFTDNEELAMQLRADVLPGQWGRLHEAFNDGVNAALAKMFGM